LKSYPNHLLPDHETNISQSCPDPFIPQLIVDQRQLPAARRDERSNDEWLE